MLQRGPTYFLFLIKISDKASKKENVEIQWATNFWPKAGAHVPSAGCTQKNQKQEHEGVMSVA